MVRPTLVVASPEKSFLSTSLMSAIGELYTLKTGCALGAPSPQAGRAEAIATHAQSDTKIFFISSNLFIGLELGRANTL